MLFVTELFGFIVSFTRRVVFILAIYLCLSTIGVVLLLTNMFIIHLLANSEVKAQSGSKQDSKDSIDES
jgi:hypothetical protein